ncbi:hypothetical protein K491DRAFT_753680 [Lophiostoma macrostomum CBS 122681]|uniref:Uncharacterized protein n=1 Tax=Lophiostoma macrostomum CBS 122681 TaxID=1314788 RepID=A0A6A6TRG5_9PLEO|nr:hypothetical protein K491DRAFT_753680 [Lophiostoma macrostomum CBS 122681]
MSSLGGIQTRAQDPQVGPFGDPSLPPPGPYFLDRLPPELRNRIYDFALHDEAGLFFRGARSGGAFKPAIFTFAGSTQNYNQLKLVSRQLWHETRGLGLFTNELVFAPSEIHSASASCSAFLRSCTPAKRRRIAQITILEKFCARKWRVALLFDVGGVLQMRRWCARLPGLQVTVRMCWPFRIPASSTIPQEEGEGEEEGEETELNVIDYNYYGIVLALLTETMDAVPPDMAPWQNEILDDVAWAVNAFPQLTSNPLGLGNLRFRTQGKRWNLLEWGDSDLMREWPAQYLGWVARVKMWHEEGF